VWIAPTPPASSPPPAREPEPEPERGRVARVPRAGRQPHHWWYLAVGELSERREWVRADESTWEERDPNGAVIRFRVLGRVRERGRAGVVVRRLPDEGLDVLIPDLGSAGWPQARVAPDGDWHDLGPMHLIE
jgi:hypothetical protein